MIYDPGDVIFETVDIYNVIVSLTADTWYEHILVRHPEVGAYIEEIQRSIEHPHVVSRKATTRFYRVIDAGKNEYAGLYLTSVVNISGVGGTVSTAYFESNIRRNEEIVYTRQG